VVSQIELGDTKRWSSVPRSGSHRRRRGQEGGRAPRAESSVREHRPAALVDGDHAVVALESLSGVEGEPVKQEEMVLEIGGADTFEAFTENLRGVTPGKRRNSSNLSGGIRRARLGGGRCDPRHPEGLAQEGTAGAERRIRARIWRLPQCGRAA